MEIVLEFWALEDKAAANLVGGKSRRSAQNLGSGPGCAIYHPCNLSRVLSSALYFLSCKQAQACPSSGVIGVSGNGK